MQRKQLTILARKGHPLKQKDLKLASLGGQQPDKCFLVGAYANDEMPSVPGDLNIQASHTGLYVISAGARVIMTNNPRSYPVGTEISKHEIWNMYRR